MAHITYSHEATSPSDASGMRTPPPPCLSVEAILSQMEEDLAALWESGQEVTVTMLAQEISRLAQDYEPPSTTHNIFRVLAGISRAYLAPGMELGIALAPRWTQWLNSLESNVRRTAHALDDLPSGTEDEEEGAIFMGHPSKKGSNKRVRDGSDRRRRRTRTTSTSIAPWTTAPWRKDRADRREGRREPEPTSSRTPPTTANATRSANRMTWRTLLGMNDSGPCLNMSAHVPSALDEDQSNNIQATLENMTLEERMTLLSGFSCFMQELCVEVMTLFVVRAHEDAQLGTNAPRYGTDDGDEDEEPDNMMTMQLSTTSLDLARTMFGNVQTSLDKMGVHKTQRAAALLRALRPIMQGMSPSLLEEAQGLVAVLIVLSHENPPDAEETFDDQDNAWVNAWTQHLRGMVQQVAQREGQSSSSTGIGTVMVDSQDTPSTDAVVAGGGPEITAEDKATMRMLEKFEAEEAARRHRLQEQHEFEEEMNRGACKVRKLDLAIRVTTASGISSTRMSIPTPNHDDMVQIHMTLKPVEPNPKPDDNSRTHPENDVEDAPLVQTQMRKIRMTQRRRLHHLLQGLQEHIQQKAARNMQMKLARQLHTLLAQISAVLGMLECTEDHQDTSVDLDMDEEAETFGNLLFDRMNQILTHFHNIEPEDDINDVLEDISRVMQERVASMPEARRRRTATSSTGSLRTPERPTTDVIARVAEDMRRSLDGAIMIRGVGARADTLREVILQMLNEAQLHSARLRTMVRLLEHYLPQPMAEDQDMDNSRRSFGRAIWKDVRDWLHDAYCTTAGDVGNGPITMEQALVVLNGISNMAIEIMTFLESTECPWERSPTDGSPSPGSPPLLPPWMVPEVRSCERRPAQDHAPRATSADDKRVEPDAFGREVQSASAKGKRKREEDKRDLLAEADRGKGVEEGRATSGYGPGSAKTMPRTTPRARDITRDAGASSKPVTESPKKKGSPPKRGGPKQSGSLQEGVERIFGKK